jgi:hypothetical protein
MLVSRDLDRNLNHNHRVKLGGHHLRLNTRFRRRTILANRISHLQDIPIIPPKRLFIIRIPRIHLLKVTQAHPPH